MKTVFRILGTAAAVAVTGAAIVVLDKILNDKDPLHVEQVEFPEEAEKDTAEAAKVAEAYAEGEAKQSAEPGDAWPPAFEKAPEAPAEEEAKTEEPAAPAETPIEPEAAPEETPAESAAEQTAPETAEEAPAFDPDAPNPNPVEAGPAVAPKDENGKFDTTKIADASDFGDWEEQGCKG